MVYTHIPANILLCLVPLMPDFWLAVAVLLLRATISQMDVPARAAYSHDDAMQLLTISDFNAHHTLVCLSADAAAKVDPSKELEGFWASERTSADWPYAEILAKRKMQAAPAARQPSRPAPAGQKPRQDRGRPAHNSGRPGKPRRPS